LPAEVEVFADITCPFTHVGLKLVAARLAEQRPGVECRVRAWPLEWVNGTPLEGDAVAVKIQVLRDQLGREFFTGFQPDRFPTTTIPALNLAAAAYAVDAVSGLLVSMELRDELFEKGRDIADPEVLAEIASRHGLDAPPTEPSPTVKADYADGRGRGVRGSPDFFIGANEFFCPALDLDHDDAGQLLAAIDIEGLEAFISTI
jgi:predicted DsbA family dithiol-disulfide isomerase